MSKILAIIKKNVIRLLESKLSASVILLGPLILMLLLGLTMSESKINNISAGVFVSDMNDEIQGILDSISNDEIVFTYFDTIDSCIESVKNGMSHICIQIPEIKDKQGRRQVIMHADYSRLNLVWAIINTFQSSISGESSNLRTDMTTHMLNQFSDIHGMLKEKMTDIDSFILDVESIQQDLNESQKSIKNFDLKFNIDMVDDISDMKKDISRNRKILKNKESESLSRLDSYDKKLEHYEEETSSLKTELDQISSGINQGNSIAPIAMFTFCESNIDVRECSELLNHYEQINETETLIIDSQKKIDTILDDLHSARSDIKDMKKEISATTDDIDDELTKLDDDLVSANSELTAAQVKIDKGENVKSDFEGNIIELSQKVELSKNRLNDMSNELGGIVNNLENATTLRVSSITDPISTTVKPLLAGRNMLDYAFPFIMVVVMMFVGILISATVILKEKTSSANFRNYISPTSKYIFLFSNFLTSLLIVLLQSILILMVAKFFFNLQITISTLHFVFASIIIITFFVLLGMTIAYSFISEETTIIASILVACLFFLLSDLIVPFEKMNPLLVGFLKYNPFYLATSLLRQLTLFGFNFDIFISWLIPLLFLIMITFFWLVFAEKESRA